MGDGASGASAIAGIFAADAQAKAAKKAAAAQMEAIQAQRDLINSQLSNANVQSTALSGDQANARNRLALQLSIDPSLYAARGISSANLLDAVKNNSGDANNLASELYSEINKPNPKVDALKNQLLDEAAAEIKAGATLPPDVQAELVKAGLERSGALGTGTSRQGPAGDIANQLIGLQGLKLQQDRIARATELTSQVDALSTRRASLLASVFPSLSNLQTQNVARNSAVLSQVNSMTPQAGLSGSDLANLLMGRVGALNSLTSQGGNVQAGKESALGQAEAYKIGSIGAAVDAPVNLAMSLLSSYMGGGMGGGGGGGGGGQQMALGGANLFGGGGGGWTPSYGTTGLGYRGGIGSLGPA